MDIISFFYRVVKDKIKTQKRLENLLTYTPKPFRGFLESAWDAKQYIEAGDTLKATMVMAEYVNASATKICETVRSPSFTILLYKVTICAAKILGAIYGSIIGLAANELVDYLEEEIEMLEALEKVSKKKELGKTNTTSLDAMLL